MLNLDRRIGETIRIGDQITITVLGIVGNKVRLGTSAPPNVTVHREEIYWRIKAEGERTARAKPIVKRVPRLRAVRS